ncbi:MAG TPA: hypothetical protein VJV96_00250 [Candidatus Angelobacter sp.]|nr:hypothetical protein [Candidatus Angelobacter sp.]
MRFALGQTSSFFTKNSKRSSIFNRIITFFKYLNQSLDTLVLAFNCKTGICLALLIVLFAGTRVQPQNGATMVSGATPDNMISPITYHNGPIMPGPHDVYFIWYGNWIGHPALSILPDLIHGLNGSPYFNVNTIYNDSTGATVDNLVSLNGQIFDNYSQGTSLSAVQVFNVVNNALVNGSLPYDANGIYFVLTSADVAQTSTPTASGAFCQQSSQGYCGWHYFGTFEGRLGRIAFVGNPATQCPATAPLACSHQSITPNGDEGADAMANVIAHELSEAVTDPNLTAWYDNTGQELADKCNFTFGSTFPAPNGSQANVALGGRNFLLQQLWINSKCVTSLPPPPSPTPTPTATPTPTPAPTPRPTPCVGRDCLPQG